MKILVVEDEEDLAQSICRGLEKVGFAADYVTSGEEASLRVSIHHMDYDLLVLDLMLPDKDGFAVCQDIRRRGITIPILMLTARDVVEDKVHALEEGVDDYLVKPFSFRELVARIRALLRRPVQALPVRLDVGGLVLDAATRAVTRDGKHIPLTVKEFSMLEYLMRNAGTVINREEIFSHVWDFNSDSFSNVVDVHMKNLRKKLDNGHEKKAIQTVRGIGYSISV